VATAAAGTTAQTDAASGRACHVLPADSNAWVNLPPCRVREAITMICICSTSFRKTKELKQPKGFP